MSVIGEVQTYIAKGRHKSPCALCGEPIVIGQECRRWCWKDDDPLTIKVHRVCDDEAQRFDWYADPDGWPFYALREQRTQDAADAAWRASRSTGGEESSNGA